MESLESIEATSNLTRTTVARLTIGMKATLQPELYKPATVQYHSRVKGKGYLVSIKGFPTRQLKGPVRVWVEQERKETDGH